MAVLTVKNDVNNIKNLFNDILSTNSSYFLFVGRTLPWANDSIPPTAVNDYEEFEQSIYSDLVFGKQITNNNIIFLIANNTWTNNTPYAQYDPNNANLFTSNFFVVNLNNNVYKCIDNNNGANSIVQPQITPTTGIFQTSDGYTWKYMYTVPIAANIAFSSTSYIPCVPNTFVANNAIPGTIDIIRLPSSGQNFQGYNTGTVQNIVNQNTLKIANGVGIDNFYTGSSIYLNAGLGASQLRKIISYSAGTQNITVNPAFNVFVNLFLANNVGNFILGETVKQLVTDISYIFPQGFFNNGDTIIQSDTVAMGTIGTANSTTVFVNQLSLNNFNVVGNAYPIIDTSQSPVAQTGLLSVTAGSNVITSNTANLLNYSVNNYIQVGINSNSNIRRITSITNSSVANVSIPFANTLVANVHYRIPSAFEPTSVTLTNSNGNIVQVNLSALSLNYNNTSSNNISFIIGETVKEYDVNNIDQHSNGIISYVNSSVMILSNINGGISSNLFLVGQSSGLKAQIVTLISYPNITLANTIGNFVSGFSLSSYYANGAISGNANLLSSLYSPSTATPYVISPTVNINGDGQGAMAYSVVNTAIGNNFSLAQIVMINNGNNFTYANVSITANTLWGNGAVLNPVISPVGGHGSNTYVELGAIYGGISVTIDTAFNESFYFPTSGSYRRFGIIKNPLFNDVFVQTDNVHRFSANIQITNSNTFVNNELIYQYSNNAGAKIVSANSTVLVVDNINGTFTSNSSNASVNNLIIGLTSLTTANVVSFNPVPFNLITNNQIIHQSNSSATGILTQVISNTEIRITNVSAKFTANTIVYDPTTNGYANVIALLTANGTTNATATFGNKFNQTSRLTLSSNSTTPFQVGEFVNQQVSNASGLVIDTSHEIDLIYTPNHGTITTGLVLTDNTTTATAIVIFANTTYLRLRNANGTFNSGDVISSITANGNITSALNVLLVSDVYTGMNFQTGADIVVGNTSGAQGLLGIANTIIYPDLVRNSGDVLYISDIAPFVLTANSKETFNVVIKL